MVAAANTIKSSDIGTNTWCGHVALIAKPGGPNTGVGRYVYHLQQGLRELNIRTTRVAPAVPPLPEVGYQLIKRLGADVPTFLRNYPVWANYPAADVYHITSQNLASLLMFRRPRGKVVVTVHDIFPYMLRADPRMGYYRTPADRLFDRMAMAGLKRADRLIAVSHYTKRTVVEHLGIAPERIDVIYEGIDHARFRPLTVPETIRERYQLPAGRRYLIYVGSEDPRKNLSTLVRALAAVRRSLPDVELIKVGRAHVERERQRLLALAGDLGVRPAIHFLEDVDDDHLPYLYNLADVCVMPSLYEGFGFPVLEAMACGTSVVCIRAASVAELLGEAGVMVIADRDINSAFPEALYKALQDIELQESLRSLGMRRAAEFTWTRTNAQMTNTYRDIE